MISRPMFLYINGKYSELPIPITDIEPTAEPAEREYISFDSEPMTITCEFSENIKYKFYLLIGEKRRIPNNWLKHRGYPMNRRKAKV